MNKHFITFEGPEGSGKTSVIEGVKTRLNEQGYEVIITREPGGVAISEAIRNIILDVKNTALDPITEALLFAASRRQHVLEVIEPALQAGKIVLCDRYVDSSLAYQGVGRDLGIEKVFELNQFAIQGLLPILTVFIDVPPAAGLARIQSRANHLDRLDRESLRFHEKVYQGYQTLAVRYPQRFQIINGMNALDDVITEAYDKVINHLTKE